MTNSYDISLQNLDLFLKEVVKEYQLKELKEDKLLEIFEKYSKKKKKRGRPSKNEELNNDFTINTTIKTDDYENIEWIINLFNDKKKNFKLNIINGKIENKIVTCDDDKKYKEYIIYDISKIYILCENIVIEKLSQGYYFK